MPGTDGSFGTVRRHEVHTGVDLYCPQGTRVKAIEAGTVVSTFDFTGPLAGSPWWLPTRAVMVEGASGVILYGEVDDNVFPGEKLLEGDHVGVVRQVLREDRGKPTAMLHLELYVPGTKMCCELQAVGDLRPIGLLDPTPMLEVILLRCMQA